MRRGAGAAARRKAVMKTSAYLGVVHNLDLGQHDPSAFQGRSQRYARASTSHPYVPSNTSRTDNLIYRPAQSSPTSSSVRPLVNEKRLNIDTVYNARTARVCLLCALTSPTKPLLRRRKI